MSAGDDLSGRGLLKAPGRSRGRFAEVESYLTGPPQMPLEVLRPRPAPGQAAQDERDSGNPPEAATLAQMQAWAAGVMAARPPDFVIGDDYLRRWYVVPRNAFSNLYLHQIRRSDDDRALHDHPWANSSFVLAGRYREHTPGGVFERVAGDFVMRPAEALHRLELYPDELAISLFATGPKVREWGFACPQGWRHWEAFTAPVLRQAQDGRVVEEGRGCGE